MVRHRDWEELGMIATAAFSCAVCQVGLCALVYVASTWGFWWCLSSVALVTCPFLMIAWVFGFSVEEFMEKWRGQ